MKMFEIELIQHYKKILGKDFKEKKWLKGPFHKLPKEFKVLEFSPSTERDTWLYATVGMSLASSTENPIELHVLSNKADFSLIELLTVVAHYHILKTSIDLGDTVNFGRPWQDDSECEYGYISLPYLYGPELEDFAFDNKIYKCYWLIPITAGELAYKKEAGIDALEDLFEGTGFNYLDPHRVSLA